MINSILPRPTDNFKTTANLLRILADAGARFTLVAHRGKRPVQSKNGTTEHPAEGWQFSPYTLDEALAWRGNVGMLCGDFSDGIGTIDADDDTDLYPAQFPQLADAIYVWRDDAPERGKYVVKGPAGYLCKKSDKKKFPTSLDILFNQSTGGGHNAVVTGVHEDGATLQWRGSRIPELTADELDAIWAWRCTQLGIDPINGVAAENTVTETDYRPKNYQISQADGGDYVQTVLDAWKPLDVFKRFGLDTEGTEPAERGGLRLRGNNGLVIRAGGEEWFNHGSQVGGGTVQAWAWCTRRSLAPRGKEFIAIIDEMAAAAGIAKPEKKDPTPDLLALRDWLIDADFATIVDHRDALGRYRTGDTDRRVADAALAIMMDAGTLTRRISGLELSERTGLGDNTCAAAMQRLHAIFEAISDGEAKTAPVYRVAYIAMIKRYNQSSQCTQQALATHNGHDAFVRSMTPLTLDQWEERMLAREERRLDAIWHNKHENATGVPQELLHVPEPARMTAQDAKRMAADLPSAGPGLLLAITQLQRNGAMSRKDLAEAMHKTKHAVSRIVQRGFTLDLLIDDAGLIDIHPDWQRITDEKVSQMPTAGRMEAVRYNAAQRRARWAQGKDDEWSQRMKRRWAAIVAFEGCKDATPAKKYRHDADLGLRTPGRDRVADVLADAAYWNRLGKLTDNQRYYVEMAMAA